MKLVAITNDTCINKVRAFRNVSITEEDEKHRLCQEHCENYRPVKQFADERYAYLNLYEVER